jgi:hypothetical protein
MTEMDLIGQPEWRKRYGPWTSLTLVKAGWRYPVEATETCTRLGKVAADGISPEQVQDKLTVLYLTRELSMRK